MLQPEDIKQINLTIEEAREKVELAKALDRLHKNKDFKKVFLENYLDKRPKELARFTCQALLNEKSALVHQHALIGLSSLQGYMHSLYMEAAQAEEALNAVQEELREVAHD